ncbi:MAG: 3-dehydroquinate dehydratase [Actinobacteria bacterium]|nr:3-dehydroquinate dehydratase [Actinomycetota bacterium]
MSRILLLHGPNLDLLGQREPEVYGPSTLDDYVKVVRKVAEDRGWSVDDLQSNHEGDLIDAIHGARGRHDVIIINAGALTHYSWSIHDALGAFEGRIIEVHISNPHAREAFRHTSVITPKATNTIVGLGLRGYEIAAQVATSRSSRP